MVTIIIIAGIAVALACVGIVAFARKAGNTATNPSVQVNKVSLTQEQAQSINDARSRLTSARMTLSRIKDPEINKAGNAACDSIEKVLHTLKDKPEKIQTTRQLFNYYLPTIDKVVSRYQRIEASGVDNPQMPEKLKAYLKNVNDAMGNLYDGLFDNDKLNVEVDIEAMTIAIKRDGLLDDEDFKNIQQDEGNASRTGDEPEGEVLELNL